MKNNNEKLIRSLIKDKLKVESLVITLPNEYHYMVFIQGHGHDYIDIYNNCVSELLKTGLFKTTRFPYSKYSFSVYINNKIHKLRKKQTELV
jgi:hypothetical protein